MISFVAAVVALGQPSYLESVPDVSAFESIARESRSRPDLIAATKFLAPAADDPTLLPTVYQNVNVHAFHADFMSSEFPERFPGLTAGEYRRLTELRATREYFAGSVARIRTSDGETLWGFQFYTDPSSIAELPRLDEVAALHALLSSTFALRPLVYAPLRSDVMELTRTWERPPFAVYLPTGETLGRYQAYTPGTTYGRVRMFTLRELLRADELGELTVQDVVVVDEAPADLTSPLAGVITGGPQTELSHLSLRLAQRGTFNVFAADYETTVAPFDGQLVRLDADDREILVRPVDDIAEAEAWWEANRPRLNRLPGVDLSAARVAQLDELVEIEDPVAKYGAKATNLALLRSILPPENVVDGVAIPLSWYQRFLDENTILDEGVRRTYQEHVEFLLADERFRSDPVYRTERLRWFVEFAEFFALVPEELIASIADAVTDVFGNTSASIRLRSSANLEDIVPFNGAGLYRSATGCAADSLDNDDSGPSACDSQEVNERTLERALRRVWSSVWLPRAFNERDFWRAPHDSAKMGVLVTPRFADELANGVVLTGNPALPGDDRVLINVQLGDENVVHPDPGILPEKVVVEVAGGAAIQVDRVRGSSLVDDGDWILTIEEARQVAQLAALAHDQLAERFDVGFGEILLDLEFKIVETLEGDRVVVFKQMRPFLRESGGDVPTLALVVPRGTELCGTFVLARSLATEYALGSTLSFIPGRVELPGRAGSVPGELIEELRLGSPDALGQSRGDGSFRCDVERVGGGTFYRYRFEETWDVGDSAAEVSFEFPSFFVRENGTGVIEVVLDEAALVFEASLRGVKQQGDEQDVLRWSPCGLTVVPRFESRFVAPSGDSAILELRHQPVDLGAGVERVVAAEIHLSRERRESADYWQLVYAADIHNWNRRFWVFLEPPVGAAVVAELREPTHFGNQPAAFRLLDENFEVLRDLGVSEWRRTPLFESENPDFVRGDVNGDGSVSEADLFDIIGSLFQAAGPLQCADAADTNDSGSVDVSDAIRLVQYLVFDDVDSNTLPHPGVRRCGKDLQLDELPICGFAVTSCP